MSFMKKAVVWLGLNEEYPDSATDPAYADEGWDENGAAAPGPKRQVDDTSHSSQGAPSSAGHERGGVRAVPMDETANAAGGGGASAAAGGAHAEAGVGTVRAVPLAETPSPEVVVPESFNNAQDVADVYREATPVVVDLTNAERDLARRLIDFSAGLCYGLGGRMEKLTTDVYLLIPEGAEVSAADRERHS